MTTTEASTITPDLAAQRLRVLGFTVRPHGARWLVYQEDNPRRLTLTPDDLLLADQVAHFASGPLTIDDLAEHLYAETGEPKPGTQSPDPPGGWGYQSLLIRQIRRDGGTQARVGLNEDTVQDYAELMRESRWDFQRRQRPIVLYDGESYWLADGFHRIEAAQRAGLSDYPVEVLRGTKRDAILRSAGANADHGLRRTNADKRRAVELLLRDEEWRQWSDRKIAEVCAVDHKTVADVRKSLGGELPHLTTRQGADGKSYPVAPAPTPRPEPSCTRCGAPRSERLSLTTYGPGLIEEYIDREVTLCNRCIPELLKAQRAREQAAESDRVAYEAKEAADRELLTTADLEIASGNVNYARQLLDRVQVLTYRRDQLLATLPAPATGRQITLALSPEDCAALLREARLFAHGGELTKRLPAIGALLVVVVEGIKGQVQP